MSNLYSVILRLFLVSGIAGIMYEVLWIRIFTFLLGSTTQSVSAVITAFMLGIAIGNYFVGHFIDQKRDFLWIYGLLEIGTAISSAIAFFLFLHIESLYTWLYSIIPYGILKWLIFLIAFIFITIPAALIGGTLPSLVKFFVKGSDHVKKQVGRLYAVNTWGAALGTFLTGFYCIRFLGYENSVLICIFLNLFIGILALTLRQETNHSLNLKRKTQDSLSIKQEISGPLILICFTLSGFTSLAYEILWFRISEFVFYGTIIGFSIVLSIFLLGLGLGSQFFSKIKPPKNSNLMLFSYLQWAIAFIAILTLPFLTLTASLPYQIPHKILVVAIITFSTFLFGGTFPLAARLYTQNVSFLGQSIGNIYTANTLGAVAGSFLTGFFIIPLIGSQNTFIFLAILNTGIGFFLYFHCKEKQKKIGVSITCIFILGFLILSSHSWIKQYHGNLISKEKLGNEKATVIATKESPLGTLNVIEHKSGMRMLTQGPFISGSTASERRFTQKLQAHLPMLIHPNPQKTLEIGYGIGEILHSLNLYQPNHIDLVEIDPDMIPFANMHFSKINQNISDSSNIQTHIMDGRHFLKMTNEKYDLIMSDSMALKSEGSLRLYTLEHFREGHSHLKNNGFMLLWLPLGIGEMKTKIIMKTFLEVFPESLLWIPELTAPQYRESFLIGFKNHIEINLNSFLNRFQTFAKDDLEKIGWTDPYMFLNGFKAGPEILKQITLQTNTLNRDMNPILDYIDPFGGLINISFINKLSSGDNFNMENFFVKSHQYDLVSFKKNLRKIKEANRSFESATQVFNQIRPNPYNLSLYQDILYKYPMKSLSSYPQHTYAKIMVSMLNQMAGSYLLENKNPKEAYWFLKESKRYYPFNFETNLGMAKYFLNFNNCSRAKFFLERAETLNPYSRKIDNLNDFLGSCS